MLFEEYEVRCVRLLPSEKADGEGGTTTAWEEGESFNAAITFDRSMAARKAQRDGVTSLYTVTVSKAVPLRYADAFRRVDNNKIFRVTNDGDDVQTPARASFSFAQVTAEEWRLP